MCLRSSNMLSAKGLVQAKDASATCPFFAEIFLLNPTYILNCNFKACRLTAHDPFRTFKIKIVWLKAKRTEDPEFPDSIRALWEKVVGGMLRGSAFCQGVVEPKRLIKVFFFVLRNWVGWDSCREGIARGYGRWKECNAWESDKYTLCVCDIWKVIIDKYCICLYFGLHIKRSIFRRMFHPWNSSIPISWTN